MMTLFSFLLISSTQSNAAIDDICTKIPGKWKGSFTFKNKKDCKLFGGCTHQVTGKVKRIADSDYLWRLSFAFGEKEIEISCKNGQIINIADAILTCDDIVCTVRYNCQRVSGELKKR